MQIDPELIEKLVAYARRRVARVGGTRVDQPADYVARAVHDTLCGRRHLKAGTSMFLHLAGTISSLINLDAQSAENRLTSPWPAQRDDAGAPILFDPVDPTPDAQAHLLRREVARTRREAIATALDDLRDDPPLRRMALIILSSPQPLPPRQVARLMDVPVPEVTNMRRRLQRRLAHLKSLLVEG